MNDHDLSARRPDRRRPRIHRLTIVAQDPDVRREDGRILTALAPVPVDRLEPGPRGHRFHVVDYDATDRKLVKPVADLCDPAVKGADIAGPASTASRRPRTRPRRGSASSPDGVFVG